MTAPVAGGHTAGDRREAVKIVQITAVVLTALIAFGFVAILVLSSSDWGRERVRRWLVAQLQGVVHGRVTIGRVHGNLLTGGTVDAFAITDSAGQPFIAAEQASASYGILEVLTKKLDLHNVRLVRPLIVLDRPPGGKWNYQRIFPPADTTKPHYVRRQGFPWIVLHDVTMLDGHLVVRAPWHPDRTLSRAAQDSQVHEALGGGKRLMVVPVAGGYQKVVELQDVIARAPLVRITQPGFKDRLAQIATLQMQALPFRPPSAHVNDLAGNLRFNNDSIWWSDIAVRMPGSAMRGSGRYTFSNGDMIIAAKARPAAFADFRWVFPRFPSEGGGPLDFTLQWRGTTEDYYVRNADVETQGARLRGRFAITFADTFSIHDTDIRFTNVNTKLVEQLAPGFHSPRRGTLDGQLAITGGEHAMWLAGDVTFHDPSNGTSHVAGSGAVGFARGELRMRDMRVRVDPLQVALLKSLSSGLRDAIGPVNGTLVGRVAVNGSTGTSLAISGDIEHRDRGGVSRLSGSAGLRLAGQNAFNIDLQARPLSLAEVGLFVPALGLRGNVSGPLHLTGTLSDFRIVTVMRLPDGGVANLTGRLNLASRTKGYDMTGRLRVVNLNSVIAKAPATSLTGEFKARGSGFQLATINTAFAADFAASRWDTLAVDSGSVRVAIANGLARVERLTIGAKNSRITAAGTFGLVASRSGELRYNVQIDSLAAFNALIPGSRTGVEQPRTEVVSRALARARADSIRTAQRTEVERAATGRPMLRLAVDTPHAISRDVVSGTVYAAGTLTGNVKTFDLRGRLNAQDVIARGNSAKSLRAEYAWTNVRTRASRIDVSVAGSELSVKGFAFDTLEGRLNYQQPTGELALAIRQGNDRDYSASGTFVVGTKRQVRVNSLTLRMDTTVWSLAHAAEVHWHAGGVEVHDVELRSNSGGLVSANGMLPTEGRANLTLDVQNFQLADVTSLLQSDLRLRGILTARGVLTGSMRDPQFHGAAGLVNGNYNGSVIPDFQATFNYANASLAAHVEALRTGRTPSIVADAQLPINLAVSGVTGPRLLDLPLHVDVSGDSLPLDLVPALTDVVMEMRGVAAGAFAVRGTLKRPTFAGAVTWTRGSVRIVPTGMFVHDIAASVRMQRDTIFVDSIAGISGNGPVTLTGHMFVGTWRDPQFDLHLVAIDAQVLNNERGNLKADVGLSMTGPMKNAYISGLVHVRQGVGYVPEPTHKNLVNAGDPAVFAFADTAVLYDRELFPTSNALLANMRIDVDVIVNRNTWLRSRDMNIEMYTEEPVRVHREADALALTGVVSTDRGEYTFLSKRFQVKRGSATFTGGPELNPLLQATGEYEVVVAGRPNFNVRVLIGGTMQKPKLTLESDAQPPISQSDLLSYLAFGRSTGSLLQVEGSGLTGATATGNLVGVGAALATQRMAAVALGVMADEVEGEATKSLGADVFNITPADVPTELGAVGSFLQSTRIEAGKYMSPYFFLGVQTQLQVQTPGVRGEYRTSKGWRYEASIEPRYLLQPPSLAFQPIHPISTFGGFIIREWRF